MRIKRNLSSNAAVTENERIVLVELQRRIADLMLLGFIFVGDKESQELARGDAAGFDRAELLENSAHMPMQEEPEVYARAVPRLFGEDATDKGKRANG